MTNASFAHKDILESLNKNLTLKEKLVCTHEAIKQFFPFLARIAITIYDPATTLLKSYTDSSDHPTQWEHCEAHLEELPSLKEVLDKGHPRVINNMVTFENDEYGHIKKVMRPVTPCLSLIMVCSQVLSFSIPIKQMSLPMMYSMSWTS